MNLRLFALRDLTTGRCVPDLFFPNKTLAKQRRNELGAHLYCVTYGPDHHKFLGR